MDNPTNERTTVTVKGLSVTAWNEAKKAATKTGEPMGVWLSRAIVEQANREAGRPRELPPEKPTPLTPDQLTARMTAVGQLGSSIASIKQSTGRATGRSALQRSLASLEQLLNDAEGPPSRVLRIERKTTRQTKPIEWQAGTNSREAS
jgi:hypothetical protein